MAKELEKIPKEDLVVPDEYDEDELSQEWFVSKKSDNYYLVTGDPIERLMSKVNIFDIESRQYMQRCLNNMGVMEKLQEMGIKSGDVIDVLGYQLEYEE